MKMNSTNPSPFNSTGLGGIMEIADQVRRSFESASSKTSVSAATAAAAQQLADMNKKRKLDSDFQSSTSAVWRKTRPFHSPIASLTWQENAIKEIVPPKPKKKKESRSKNIAQKRDGITLNAPPHQIFVTYNDVVCGRGKMTNNLVGNQRYRVWINSHRYAFSKAPSDEEKRSIACSIVNTITTSVPSGRFLSLDIHSGMWYDIGPEQALNVTMEVLQQEAKHMQGTHISPSVNNSSNNPKRSPKTVASRAA